MIVRIDGANQGLSRVKMQDGKIISYSETYNSPEDISEGFRRYENSYSDVTQSDLSYLFCPWCEKGIRERVPFDGANPETVTLKCRKCKRNGIISEVVWNRIRKTLL